MRLGDIFRLQLFLNFLPMLIRAVPVALLITFVAFFCGLVIGLLAAICKIRRVPFLHHFVTVYISFFRGTPLLVQLFIAYFGFPILMRDINIAFNLNIDVTGIKPIAYALIVFSLNTGAYLTETVRSAIEAIDEGQREAAYSIGMTGWQTNYRIILPQAFLVALPNLGNTIIALVKDTSLAYTITIIEILNRARLLASGYSRTFEAYFGAALVYWVICLFVEFIAKILEKWLKRRRGLLDDTAVGN